MAITGRAVALSLAGVLAVLIAPSTGTALAWLVLVLAVVLLDLTLAPRPSALTVRREPSAPIRFGGSGSSRLIVTNASGRRVRAHLRDAWQPSAGVAHDRISVDLRPGASQAATMTLTPTRRGDRRTDLVTLRLRGPLGLAARQASTAVPGVQRVLPAFESRRHLPSLLATLRQLDGRSAVRTRGAGTEFDSLRDYVDGDDVRSIDWRASARRQGLVVRSWQPERDRHLILVVDSSRTSAARVGDVPRLDASLEGALLLGALAARAGDRVELIAGDCEIRARVGADRDRHALLTRMMDRLAGVSPALVEADWSVLSSAVMASARRRSLVVLFTSLEQAPVEEGLLPVLRTLARRHQVVLASCRDPELVGMAAMAGAGPAGSPEPAGANGSSGANGSPGSALSVDRLQAVYDAAAAERALARRRHTAEVLTRLGVRVVDEPPHLLAPAVCELYLALKARGRL